MKINSISAMNYATNTLPVKQKKANNTSNPQTVQSNSELKYFSIPNNVLFTGEVARRRVMDVDLNSYENMRLGQRQILRKKYQDFEKDVNKEELADPKNPRMPLKNDVVMEHFINVCKKYAELKDEPVLCLGRSPKWFLSAATWLEGGFEKQPPYVSFSKYWYRYKNAEDGMVRMDNAAPTPEEKKRYKRYLKRIQADPKSIIQKAQETGKKYVITDYVNTGKGMTSFLDLMSEYAEEDGVLDEFAHSIRIFSIGCQEYRENMYYEDEEIPIPTVQMPERLMPYNKVIKQSYYDMPLDVFEEMLLNENTNECRSSYYPHSVWTLYSPDRFKTGILKDDSLKELKEKGVPKKSYANFTPAMRDYRNLLNFRILDYLDRHDMLKETLGSKQQD